MRWRLRRKLNFWCLYLLRFLIILAPIKTGQDFGRFLGRFCYYIFIKEKKVAYENLKKAFGSKLSFLERNKILKSLFENLGQNLIEVMNLSRIGRHIDRIIQAFGMEKVDRALSQKKGAVIISAHFGNWELLAHYFAIKGYPTNVIARRMRQEDFESLLKRQRLAHRLNVIYRDEAFKEAIRALKENQILGIMPDQDIDSAEGTFVHFFGRPAYTPIGPALFAILTGAPILFCFIVHSGRLHKIFVEGPLEFKFTGDRERDISEITQRYTIRIEEFIRRYPSEWVWFHKRWKTQPS